MTPTIPADSRWTIVGRAHRNHWRVRCVCGSERAIRTWSLTSGNSKSCGCLSRECASARSTRHGQSRPQSPTYRSWCAMWTRCTNRRHRAYAKYGARGITICERWRSFENFLADMGERPGGTSIDRIDNLRGYSPENCRWATAREQVRNRSISKLDEVDVMQIRWLVAEGFRHRDVARAFDVSPSLISHIKTGAAWGETGGVS